MFSCEIPSGVVIGALFTLLSTISEGVVVGRKVGLVFSPGNVGGVSSQKNCRFSGRLFHHSEQQPTLDTRVDLNILKIQSNKRTCSTSVHVIKVYM